MQMNLLPKYMHLEVKDLHATDFPAENELYQIQLVIYSMC